MTKPRVKNLDDMIVAAILLLIFFAFLIASFSFGSRARLVPIPVAIAGIVLIVVDQLFSRVIKQRITVDSREIFSKNLNVEMELKKLERSGASDQGRETVALLIVAGLTLLLWLFGILAGLFFFVTAFFRFRNRAGLPVSFAWGLGVTLGLYVIFGLFLQVVFYHGVVLTPLMGFFAG